MRDKLLLWSLVTLLLVGVLARFVALESSPPGFYVDEAAAATHALCLAETGADADGQAHPLFFPTLAGSFSYPPWIYLSAAWTWVFGTSIFALRGVAAFASLMTLLGLYRIGRLLLDRTGARLVCLAGAISPWGFQFARIAWDPALVPCLVVWSVYFFLAGSRWYHGLLCAACAAAAMYDYPPARASMPLILVALACFRLPRAQGRVFLATLGTTFCVLLTPLIRGVVSGELQGRFQMLSIFTPEYLARTYSSTSPLYYPVALAENMLLHLGPRFLFVSGDRNLRHSTQWVGELSALDALALCLTLVALAMAFRHRQRPTVETHDSRRVLLLAATCGVLSVLPAAMTWESIPHALRAINAWPFVALFTGTVLNRALKHSYALLGVWTGVAAAFAVFYFGAYFGRYPAESGEWFDVSIKEDALLAAGTGDWDGFLAKNRAYPDLGRRYYLMHYAGESCDASRSHVQRVR